MKTIFEIAAAHNREYITPEDIVDSIKSGCSKRRIQSDVLAVLGRQRDCGAEDSSLCAFVAWEYKTKARKK